MEADATNAPEKVLSSWASSTLWLARMSLPPSSARAANHSGFAARCHCSMNRSRCCREGHGQRTHRFCRAVWIPSPKPMARVNSRLPFSHPGFQIQLAHHGDIAAAGRTKLPVHAEVIHDVAPAVACADKAATDTRKAASGAHGQGPLVLPCQQHLVAGNVHRTRRVFRRRRRPDAARAAHTLSTAKATPRGPSRRTWISTTLW